MILFGYFKGMPYKSAIENFDDYKNFHNTIPKEQVIAHIQTLEKWYTSLTSTEIFTGMDMQAGQYHDGEFAFPLEFLHYYKNYDIGIPYEYEEYLKTILPQNEE